MGGCISRGAGTRALTCGRGATSRQHPQPLRRFREHGGLGRGCLLGTEGVRTPHPVWGSTRTPVLRFHLRPRFPVSVSSFCVSTSLRGLCPAESGRLSESLSQSPSVSLLSVSLSVWVCSGFLPLSPWFLSAFLFRHLCVFPSVSVSTVSAFPCLCLCPSPRVSSSVFPASHLHLRL